MAAQTADTKEINPSQTGEHIPALYEERPSSIPGPVSQILENYSGIPQEQQIDHVMQVRDRVYTSIPYPCLGMFRFLQLDLSTHPLYNEYVLPHLKQKQQGAAQDPIFLDLGTCFGQDLRKLVVDGVSVKQLYGTDIEAKFLEAGYELFNDRTKFPANHFICPADIFDSSAEAKLNQFDDRINILHLNGVFHLFSQDQQASVAERCLRLLKKNTGDRVLVLGAQVGNVNASDFVRSSGTKRFRHSESSWRQLWESVCGSDEWKGQVKRVDVQVKLEDRQQPDCGKSPSPNKLVNGGEEGFQWMVWSVWVEFHPAA